MDRNVIPINNVNVKSQLTVCSIHIQSQMSWKLVCMHVIAIKHCSTVLEKMGELFLKLLFVVPKPNT